MNSPYYPQAPHPQWQGAAWPAQPATGYAGYGYPPAGYYPPAGLVPARPSAAGVLSNPRFMRGVLIGAAAAYLLSNEQVQQAAIRGMVQVWSLVQGGVEEMKERFRDAEAELHAGQGE